MCMGRGTLQCKLSSNLGSAWSGDWHIDLERGVEYDPIDSSVRYVRITIGWTKDFRCFRRRIAPWLQCAMATCTIRRRFWRVLVSYVVSISGHFPTRTTKHYDLSPANHVRPKWLIKSIVLHNRASTIRAGFFTYLVLFVLYYRWVYLPTSHPLKANLQLRSHFEFANKIWCDRCSTRQYWGKFGRRTLLKVHIAQR